MRIIAIITSLAATTLVAMVVFMSQPASTRSETKGNTYFTDIVATRDRSLLDHFTYSLDPTIIKECVAQHNAGKSIDLDYLATCGDFDAYARYLRISKFEAVKKFEYVVLHSSSKLEFEDRLAQ
jgi:hypothetical protein